MSRYRGWTTDEVLAIARLRQWAAERARCARPRPTRPDPTEPHSERRTCTYDAALVRCIDFERALARLPQAEQTLLLMRYREGQRIDLIAEVIGVSATQAAYLLPASRRRLARALADADLL